MNYLRYHNSQMTTACCCEISYLAVQGKELHIFRHGRNDKLNCDLEYRFIISSLHNVTMSSRMFEAGNEGNEWPCHYL